MLGEWNSRLKGWGGGRGEVKYIIIIVNPDLYFWLISMMWIRCSVHLWNNFDVLAFATIDVMEFDQPYLLSPFVYWWFVLLILNTTIMILIIDTQKYLALVYNQFELKRLLCFHNNSSCVIDLLDNVMCNDFFACFSPQPHSLSISIDFYRPPLHWLGHSQREALCPRWLRPQSACRQERRRSFRVGNLSKVIKNICPANNLF